jgi:hypothetical protein
MEVSMLRNMMKVWIAAGVLAATGCINEVDEVADCADVCGHFDDCVGGGFDSTQCTDICEDSSDFSDAFEERVDFCENCLEVAACSPQCNDVCSGVIPPF